MGLISTCGTCKVKLVVGENFTENAAANRRYICRACNSAKGKAHYQKHAEKYALMQRERLSRPREAKAISEYKSAYYQKNKEKWNEYRERSRIKTATDPWKRAGQLLTWLRSRAAKRQYEFDLTREWAEKKLEAGVCEATGIRFDFTKESASLRFNPFGPSVDRIDPKRGYVQDNCRMVVWIFNMAKSEWDDDAVLRMATALVEKRK